VPCKDYCHLRLDSRPDRFELDGFVPEVNVADFEVKQVAVQVHRNGVIDLDNFLVDGGKELVVGLHDTAHPQQGMRLAPVARGRGFVCGEGCDIFR